jgi:integrase
MIRVHLVPALGHLQLPKLTPQHVQTYINTKLASDLSARTVQYHHATLRCALNQAVRWGLVPRNVATVVDPVRVKRHEVQPLTLEDARRFLDAARGHRLEALFSVALAVGLRLGEALGLR